MTAEDRREQIIEVAVRLFSQKGFRGATTKEIASAAGVMNFLRTMSGAVATAIGTTIWYDGAQNLRAQLSGVLNGASSTMQSLQAHGYTQEQSRQVVSNLVDGQATALATGSVFVTAAIVFAAAASIVWLAPRPKHAVAAGQAH